MRKAKIVCTLGPASDSPDVLRGLIRAGMDVARLNFSHGSEDSHRQRIRLLRKLAKEENRPLAILQDIQGPKIRLGTFENGSLLVEAGQTLTVTTRKVLGGGKTIPTPVKSLPRDVQKGDAILLDDGRVRLEVLKVDGTDVRCRVVVGGVLKDKKGLNLPHSPMSVSTLTPKDKRDLLLGKEEGVDYVALSFVRTAKDIRDARRLLGDAPSPLIAKVEKPQAIDNLEEIVAEADGVMVARGDLGVELPLERLPALQKNILQVVNRAGKISIVATEMLESMIVNARPTRAEVSDVANAVLDGTDAVMLSGETAVGAYPVETAATMSRIVQEVTGNVAMERAVVQPFQNVRDTSNGIAAAAVAAATQMGIRTIVAYTESGKTARLLSALRPSCRILALTPNPRTVDRMALYWGVEGRLVGRLHSTDAMVRQVRRLCRVGTYCVPDEPIIIVAGVPLNQPGATNMMSIHHV